MGKKLLPPRHKDSRELWVTNDVAKVNENIFNKAFKGLCSRFIMSLVIFILIEPTGCETSTEIVNFIDLNVRIKNGAIFTDLYVKPI